MNDSVFRTDEVNENITLVQRKEGLTFGSDAYLLYAYMKKGNSRSRAAELGCGTGVVSLLAAAKGKFPDITAYEVQESYAELARKNTEANRLSHIVKPECADVRKLTGGEFDAVFTNPPYMKADAGKKNASEEKYIARHEVCGDIGDFCAAASRILKFGGAFYAVYLPGRMTDLICAMRNSSIEPKRITLVYPYADSKPCILLAEGKKGGSPGVFFTPPLIMYAKRGAGAPEYTEDLKYIYENGDFDERFSKA